MSLSKIPLLKNHLKPEELKKLPGNEIFFSGLQDLKKGEVNTLFAQLVLMAKIRLKRSGLMIPEIRNAAADEPHIMIFRLLKNKNIFSYSQYNAYLRRLAKFCSSLEWKTVKIK